MWPFKDKKESIEQVEDSKEMMVAKVIANEFLCGTIVKSDLDPFGISELQVRVKGFLVEISWYSRRDNFRSLDISGGNFIKTTKSANLILDAALKRSEKMLGERLESMSEKILS